MHMTKAIHTAPTQWANVILLCLKSYIVIGWLVSKSYENFAGRYRNSDFTAILWYAYWISALALTVAAGIQFKQGKRDASIFTFIWAVTAAILSTVCLPNLSKL